MQFSGKRILTRKNSYAKPYRVRGYIWLTSFGHCLTTFELFFESQAQEAFIASLDDEVKAVFSAEELPEMTKLRQDWNEYLKEMGKLESILPTLMQVIFFDAKTFVKADFRN